MPHSDPPSSVPRSRRLQLQHVDLHYLEWGAVHSPPLLLVHGGSAHAHWWDHIAVELARQCRVIALDLRGHGDSGRVAPPSYEIDDYAADIAEVAARLQLAPFVLVGHSLGGLVAQTYAARHSSTLAALVVVDMGPRLQHNRRTQLLSRVPTPVYRDADDLFRRFRLLPEETWAEPYLLQPIARHGVRELEDGRLTLKVDRATFVRRSHDVGDQLSLIACPTLLVRGAESQALSLETAQEMQSRCPALRMVEIFNAGHHVFLDNPSGFLEAVSNFLRHIFDALKAMAS
ncbi:MAG: alpha/beta hydrolase [Deltaproteobacteria bacterium]|nr:alpha/beta hydrolase [Deltaproteobacteria bacterium]